MGSSRALLLRLLPLVGALRLTTASGLVGRLAPLAAARPGYARTAAYPLLSPEVACCCAFGLYPAVVCGLRWWLAGSTHDTNAAWLRWLGAAHNGLLFVFSLVMWVGVAGMLVFRSPWASAVQFFCLPGGEPIMPEHFAIFPYLFYLSKIYELLDTVILVLKRKPIIFLHVWHHCLVIPYTWFWATSNQPWVLGGVFLNTFVHTFMYYYYCVSLFGVRPWWKRHLTKLQISQFACGAPCGSLYIYYHFFGPGCTEIVTVMATAAFDVSLIVLFAQFYYAEYVQKSKRREQDGGRADKKAV